MFTVTGYTKDHKEVGPVHETGIYTTAAEIAKRKLEDVEERGVAYSLITDQYGDVVQRWGV